MLLPCSKLPAHKMPQQKLRALLLLALLLLALVLLLLLALQLLLVLPCSCCPTLLAQGQSLAWEALQLSMQLWGVLAPLLLLLQW